jgi:hypothetical protein
MSVCGEDFFWLLVVVVVRGKKDDTFSERAWLFGNS